MKKILTGLQSTGTLTLGNYIGAIQQMIDYQDKYESYLFIADLHSITISQDPKQLKESIRSLVALYLACGIDPKKNTIFVQSDNIYHANVSWFLECNTYFGELSRMTQFKDKSSKNQNFSAGLFTYPVLMASDILIYDADYVAVGKDQKQHVELARDIGERFNKKYGKTFTIPEPLIKEFGKNITDLVDPTKKMSKSAVNKKGSIYLLDDAATIRKKVMGATTDSLGKIQYDVEKQPGISNLLTIYSCLANQTIEEVVQCFQESNYGMLKEAVADLIIHYLEPIQKRYYTILNSDEIDHILADGVKVVSKIAEKKYQLMKQKIGLGR